MKKVKPFHKECIITEESRLPDAILVIPNPIPRTNNGGISPKLKWAKAKIKAENTMPKMIPKSLERVGSKIPRNIISSNKGARRVVVTNKKINGKKFLLLRTISNKGLLPFWLSIRLFIITEINKTAQL